MHFTVIDQILHGRIAGDEKSTVQVRRHYPPGF